jgi:flagellar biosynthesis component FlhA
MEKDDFEKDQEDFFSNEVMEKKTKSKKDLMVEMMLFLILGFLLGITLKTEAAKSITMGFNDYKLRGTAQGYDVALMQKAMLKEAQLQQEEAQKQAAEQGAPTQQAQPVVPSGN